MARPISIFASPELQAVRATTRGISRELASVLNRVTKSEAMPLWRGAVHDRTVTPLQRRVFDMTSTVSVQRLNVMLQAARKGGPLSGGGHPKRLWIGAEFGSNRYKQFGPRVDFGATPGKVVYPAAHEVVPKVGALWAKNTAEVVGDAFRKV